MTVQELPARFDRELSELIERGDHVLAAVSGGADSVALLHLLVHSRSGRAFDLSLCHLNHKLRGDDADRDEAFVRQLADDLSVPGYFDAIDVQAERKKRGGSLEEVARQVRYEFYQAAADNFHAERIALAHHRDDQAETVLFNIIRGTGIHGLRGMARSRPLDAKSTVRVIRPLLRFAKRELQDYLRAKGLGWREDHTNYLPGATRNVIRHQVLPSLAGVHGGVDEHLLQLADQAYECEKLIDEAAGRIMPAVRDEDQWSRIEVWRLEGLSTIIVGDVVRRMMIDRGIAGRRVSKGHIENVLKLLAAGSGRIVLPHRVEAWIDNDWLYLGVPPRPSPRDLDQQKVWTADTCRFGQLAQLVFSKSVRAFDRDWFDDFCIEKSCREEAIDADKVNGPLVIRYSQPGERFRPLGGPGTKKIGDFLTDQKVPLSDRPAIVVADGDGPLWLVGLRIDERVKIDDTTVKVICLQFSTVKS